jgi:hypothetical protein
MIINSSRGSQFQACREKAYNWDQLRLVSFRDADPLMIGEAYHKGSEILSKVGDVEEAVREAEQTFRKRLVGQLILPEELPEIEREIEFVKHATRKWAEHYDRADFKILWPEVSGRVPLPGTEHHCWFCHQILHPTVPFNECPFTGSFGEHPHDCWQPHFFKFRTDGIIEFFHKVWLLEQKTTSSTQRNNFWTKFNMDFQVGCYLYGVWKVTGVMPAGVLVNAIIKHSVQDKARKGNNGGYKMKLDPTNVDFERDAFTYNEQQLLSFERDLSNIAREYEDAFRQPELKIYRNTHNCFSYNRACYYWERCQRKFSGQEPELPGEFRERADDYVNLDYYDLLGLPTLVTEVEPIHGTK